MIEEQNDFLRESQRGASAQLRSNGKCEMPACTRALFQRDDDTPYLEVHHVVHLAEGGEDTLANAAALCPHCHRELHSGKNRARQRVVLAAAIANLTV